MESIKNVGVMIELELRRLRHDRMELWTRAVQPILWIAIYGTIMGNVRGIDTGGLKYQDYITPGVLIQSTTFVSIFYGLTIVWERESGILKRLLVSPVSRSATVIGRSMAAGVRAIFQGLIIIPIALVIGVRFVPNPLFLLGAFLVIFFAAGGFAAISIFIASFFKTRERFMGIGQAITFPLFFTSSALYPLSMMPHVLKEIALVNPVSYVVDAVRGLMISGDLSGLPIDLLAIAVFLVVMFTVASVSFKRIIE